jgi:hypothetical protein
MANNFGTLVNSELVYDILDDLKKDLRPILSLVKNFGEEEANGNVVRTLKPGTVVRIKDWSKAFVPYNFSAGPGYIAPDYTAKPDVTVTLPTDWKAVSMAVTVPEYQVLTGAPRGGEAYNTLLAKTRRMMVHGLAANMIAGWHAIITAANFPSNTVSAAGTYNRSMETDIDTALFSRDLASRANATGILAPTPYGEWAKDLHTIQTQTGIPHSDVLMYGGKNSGATPIVHWRTNVAMPADAARGYVFTETAGCFVARIPEEATYENDPVSLQEVVDEETGLAFLARIWKNAQTGTIQFDMAIMWVFAKLQAECLQRVTLV